MAKLISKNGITSVVLRVSLLDTTSSTGGRKTGLTNSSTGLIISTIADVEATATVYTSAGSAIDTITTLGTFATPSSAHCRFREVDATNHPGVYEIQIADARWAVANAKSVVITVQATGAAPVDAEVQLSAVDLNDSVRGGMSALPSAPMSVKKNQIFNGFSFFMFDATTHQLKTGLTVSAQRTKDGGALASCDNAVTEISGGAYYINLSANDLNANSIGFKLTATGADDIGFTLITEP